jgi:glycosyltransferase involved in cell wall biosynthesis
MFVGRLSELKGADVFADAVADAPGWRGVAVGTGEVERAIADHHPGIIRAGMVRPSDIPIWLRAADVVVVPSRSDALGLVAVEALACGIPVIASDVGGLAETIHDGVNGLLVVPGNPKAIIAALERIADPDFRTRLAEAAPASVAKHSIEHTTDAMAAVWAGVGVRL